VPLRIRQAIRIVLVIGAAATPSGIQAQGTALINHNSILRSGPSVHSKRLGVVPQGEVVSLMTHGHRSGYLRVLTQDEQVGWITEHNATPLDATEVHQPSGVVSGPASATAAMAVVAGAFDGCALEGNPSPNGSNYASIEALNRLKNRSAEPTDADIDTTVTLARILAPSHDDSGRWSNARAAEIVAYVYRVIPGGKAETTNCRKGDPAHRDSHIELVASPSDTEETRRMIVEVTPRWRAAAQAQGVDWSTATLQHTIEGHWVRVRGWMFFDAEHKDAAENTHPGGDKNWRATAWEIHPVAGIVLVDH
jgi:hypothetical protein